MMFLNAALLGGLAALAIPVIIHLWNRSRFHTVEWGAMHLLDDAVTANRRRVQLDQLLLLLVRCAIPAVLAFCFARPVLTGVSALTGDAPVSLLVVLDDSDSMTAAMAATVGDRSRFDAAQEAVAKILAAQPAGSDAAILRTGSRPSPLVDQPITDLDLLARRLEGATAGCGASEMAASIDDALATLETMDHVGRELVIVSDFQSTDWEAMLGEESSSLGGRLDALPIKPAVTLLPVGEPIEANAAVEAIELPTRPIAIGQPVDIRVRVRNRGPSRPVAVRLQVDDGPADERRITVPADGTSQVLFRPTSQEAGSRRLIVTVDADDAVPADDRRTAIVPVWDRIPVLLVDGDPSGQPLGSETDYLAVALTPLSLSSGRGRQLSDLLATETITPPGLTAERLAVASADRPELIVLANVARLSDEAAAAVDAYIATGGSVLLTAGDRIDAAWANRTLHRGGRGWQPRAWSTVAGEGGGGQSSRILVQRFDHPAVASFNDPTYGDLATGEIRSWWAVSGGDDDLVALRLATGEPLLIEKAYGQGVVMQLTTAIDADWSELPLRPWFVPLMQQVAANLATRLSPPRNIAAGQPIVALFETEQTVAAISPSGSRTVVATQPSGDRHAAQFSGTRRPGLYTLEPADQPPLAFAATTPSRESAVQTLGDDGLADLSERLGASVVQSADDFLARDRRKRFGREMWTWALAGLVGLMVLEMTLQQWFSRSPA